MSQFLFLKFRTFFYDHRAGLGDPAFNWPRLQNRCAGGSPETEAPAAKSIPEEPAKSRRPRSLKQGEAKKPSEANKANEAKQNKSGAVAQLGERLICIQEVAGSIPTSSTSSGLWPTGPRPITGL
jgi:hypothetical protein